MDRVRLGIIGDIHAEAVRLERALAWFARVGVDQVAFVGDVVDGRGDLPRCIALLGDAIGVRGNHERWFLADTMRMLSDVHRIADVDPATVAALSALPPTRTIATPLGPLLLCHGMGDDDMGGLRPDDRGYALDVNDRVQAIVAARSHAIVVAGHTHQRMVRRIGDVTFINAGTLAGDDPCAAILDCIARTVMFADAVDPSILLDEVSI